VDSTVSDQLLNQVKTAKGRTTIRGSKLARCFGYACSALFVR